MTKEAPVPRRPRVTRADGEQRLVEATLALAQERPFGEWSAREIARRAGLNHAYVHMWFGSKAGLLAAAYQRQTEVIRTKVERDFAISVELVVDPDVELLFRLLGRLQTEPGGIELAQERQRPMLTAMTAHMHTHWGLSMPDAQIAASLAVAAVAGAATVGRVLDLEITGTVGAWPRIVAALAETGRT